jgi:hypothetical protein
LLSEGYNGAKFVPVDIFEFASYPELDIAQWTVWELFSGVTPELINSCQAWYFTSICEQI